MKLKQFTLAIVGLVVIAGVPRARDERGLSQSAENAILLAGAVAVATVVISVITVYVKSHLPR